MLFSGLQATSLAVAAGPSRIANTISVFGDAKTSTADKKFGVSSLLVDGVGDYISATNSAFGTSIGTGDFTFEFFLNNPSDGGADYVVSWKISGGTEMNIRVRSTGFIDYRSDGTNLLTTANSFSPGSWRHYALVRNSGVTKIYINGTADANTYSDTINYGSYSQVLIGYSPYIAEYTNGYIDEFRFSKSARYTANFTPTTTEFINDANTLLLLHCNGSNNGIIFTDDNT
jgi:hypothetical protein